MRDKSVALPDPGASGADSDAAPRAKPSASACTTRPSVIWKALVISIDEFVEVFERLKSKSSSGSITLVCEEAAVILYALEDCGSALGVMCSSWE